MVVAMSSYKDIAAGRALPARLRLPDFSGKMISLPDNPESWRCLSLPSGDQPKNILLLGGSAVQDRHLSFITKDCAVYWLESPHVEKLLQKFDCCPPDPQGGEHGAKWQRVNTERALTLAEACEIWFYTYALRLDPDFWGNFLAALEAKKFASTVALSSPEAQNPPPKTVWLPGSESLLLHQELKDALMELGYGCIYGNMSVTPESLPNLWAHGLPELVISINARGLDREGLIFHLCQNLGIPVAIWLVDNPWHILSGIPFPWWKKACLFMTDSSFMPELAQYGAKNVFSLPLATARHMWREVDMGDKGALPPLFIGRSCFPERDKYFGGVKIPPALMREAEMITDREIPDYHWWAKKTEASLWPGKGCRLPGLGAELLSEQNRARWIGAALPFGLEITGDEGWKKFFPTVNVHPPVDYYGGLPDLYHRSQAILNTTSLLLPGSLNQRHFDVWAAGGLLLTNYTKGLDIFPARLGKMATLDSPRDFGPRLKYFKDNPAARHDLVSLWREELARGHSYADRLRTMADFIREGERKRNGL